jgi:hypothetical protein
MNKGNNIWPGDPGWIHPQQEQIDILGGGSNASTLYRFDVGRDDSFGPRASRSYPGVLSHLKKGGSWQRLGVIRGI